MSTPQLDLLLSYLEGVRRTGYGRYVARCPAHGDKHPSLAIRETDYGVLLLHCFAGCDVGSVVGAVGLDISSLYPQKDLPTRKPDRRPFSADDLLILSAWESLLASIIACDIAKGELEDKDRLLVAAGRLQHVAEVANVF
jgi:hypothetical protein